MRCQLLCTCLLGFVQDGGKVCMCVWCVCGVCVCVCIHTKAHSNCREVQHSKPGWLDCTVILLNYSHQTQVLRLCCGYPCDWSCHRSQSMLQPSLCCFLSPLLSLCLLSLYQSFVSPSLLPSLLSISLFVACFFFSLSLFLLSWFLSPPLSLLFPLSLLVVCTCCYLVNELAPHTLQACCK
jgi:hypothetical protein